MLKRILIGTTLAVASLSASASAAKSGDRCITADGAGGVLGCSMIEHAGHWHYSCVCFPLASYPPSPDCTGPLGAGDCSPPADPEWPEEAIADCDPIAEVNGLLVCAAGHAGTLAWPPLDE